MSKLPMNPNALSPVLLAIASLLGISDQARAQRIFLDGFEAPLSIERCGVAPSLTGGSAFGTIDPPGEQDYYRFAANTAEWLRLHLRASPDAQTSPLDSVLTMFSPGGHTQIARNDDDVLMPGGFDSALFYRVPAAGEHCVRVEDFSTAAGLDQALGGPEFEYELQVAPLDFQVAGINREQEPNDAAAPTLPVLTTAGSGGNSLALIAGDFAASNDIDVYRVATPAGGRVMDLTFTPPGRDGYGSSIGLGVVDVVNADGNTIQARLDVTRGAKRLSVPVAPSVTYYVRIQSPTSSIGENPFYVVQASTTDQQNQQETNNTANGTQAGAEIATAFDTDGSTSYFIGGTLFDGRATGPDTDWWSLQVTTGQVATVYCASQRVGSGVGNASFAFQLGDGTVLRQEIETADADVEWSDSRSASAAAITLATSGTHYFVVQASAFSTLVKDRHYACAVRLRSL